MERYQITVLPITDSAGRVFVILHLHDILGKGEFKFNGVRPKFIEKFQMAGIRVPPDLFDPTKAIDV